MTYRIANFVVVAILCFAIHQQTSAATIDISAGASPNIRSASPTSFFDSPTETFAGRLAGGDGWIRALLDFDLSAIPDDAQIDSVSLALTINSRDGTSASGFVGAAGVQVFNLTETFNTSGVTYNERDSIANTDWTTAGGTFDATALSTYIPANPGEDPNMVSAGDVFPFVSSPEFVAAVQSGLAGDNLQLVVRTPTIESNSGTRKIYRFGSAANSTGTHPVLTVNFSTASSTPEPSSIILLSMGLIGWSLRRTRRRR